MTQLTFQPALDPMHAVFRLLRMRDILRAQGPVEIDHVRILDYYLTFPFQISQIRLKREHLAFRKISQSYEHRKPYGVQPDGRTLLSRMKPMQVAAMDVLAVAGYFQRETPGLLEEVAKDLPPPVEQRVLEENTQEQQLMSILAGLAKDYLLNGKDGLKDRTGLLEYRYDSV